MGMLKRITLGPSVMDGKRCIRGTRVTAGAVVGLLAAGHSFTEVLKACPYVERGDPREAPAYAAWRAEQIEVPLAPAP